MKKAAPNPHALALNEAIDYLSDGPEHRSVFFIYRTRGEARERQTRAYGMMLSKSYATLGSEIMMSLRIAVPVHGTINFVSQTDNPSLLHGREGKAWLFEVNNEEFINIAKHMNARSAL